ncbi:MAG: hypothetical protein CXT78_15515 [Thaumarchaeota archaeon]|nr:MAG: hypothetical protein CXT78_15515 [Nitrososphaerota archaeon]
MINKLKLLVKKNTLLGLTIISCIGVVFAVIFDDKIEETKNPTENDEVIIDNKEIIKDNKVAELNVEQRIEELQYQDLNHILKL